VRDETSRNRLPPLPLLRVFSPLISEGNMSLSHSPLPTIPSLWDVGRTQIKRIGRARYEIPAKEDERPFSDNGSSFFVVPCRRSAPRSGKVSWSESVRRRKAREMKRKTCGEMWRRREIRSETARRE